MEKRTARVVDEMWVYPDCSILSVYASLVSYILVLDLRAALVPLSMSSTSLQPPSQPRPTHSLFSRTCLSCYFLVNLFLPLFTTSEVSKGNRVESNRNTESDIFIFLSTAFISALLMRPRLLTNDGPT